MLYYIYIIWYIYILLVIYYILYVYYIIIYICIICLETWSIWVTVLVPSSLVQPWKSQWLLFIGGQYSWFIGDALLLVIIYWDPSNYPVFRVCSLWFLPSMFHKFDYVSLSDLVSQKPSIPKNQSIRVASVTSFCPPVTSSFANLIVNHDKPKFTKSPAPS